MSENQLIFSFLDGTNVAISSDELADGTVIQFGSGFKHLEMRYDSLSLRIIDKDEVSNRRPSARFEVRPEALRQEGVRADQIRDTDVTMKIQPVELADLPTTFHEGSTEEKKTRLTKSQKRNRYRKYRRQQERLAQGARITEPAVEPTVADYTPLDVVQTVEEYVPQYVPGVKPLQIISEDELDRFQSVRRQSFEYLQRIRGRWTNILEGLELHTGVFSDAEQRKVLQVVDDLKDQGRAGLLRRRTYSEPKKWMRGKGRITIQFGCCYNYALDADGNPPGIIRHEEVDPIPPFLKFMIKRMVAWHVLPPDCVPDSCIINIYEEEDCIPPHVDSHDFLRPFCTASFLGECDILLGTELRIKGPGEFSGPMRIPLPLGSVFVFAGNGADIAKHCVPAVPRPRISITFRKMVPDKLPYRFVPEPELQGLCPLAL